MFNMVAIVSTGTWSYLALNTSWFMSVCCTALHRAVLRCNSAFVSLQFVRTLGSGSYGEVAEAFDVQDNCRVAIKRLNNVFHSEVRAPRECSYRRVLATHARIQNCLLCIFSGWVAQSAIGMM